MAAIAKFARLPFPEKLLLLQAGLALAAVKAGLMTVGFAAVRRITTAPRKPDRGCLAAATTPGRASRKRGLSAGTIAWAIEAASVRVPGGRNCLVRALATEYLLHRNGYRCELRIGAKRDEAGEFTAHAWLESGGRVLIGEFELQSYTPLTATNSGRAGSRP
jgi:transglutaminase superfamily protein